ncbi:B12-binding domain-containing radical SAM protein [Streptomyces anulatus]|uniref:B12-binding domain-containing radical SAM protein n=1 Tax=Streptomyces anulatus TaxID=1892 RepID=UPI0033D185ED
MRVLVVWPPHIPSYFNAGHHLPTFTVAAYLRERGHAVDAIDAGALNYTWKEYADLVFQGGYEAIVVMNEYDVVEGVRRAVDYGRALCPDALLVTAGRLSQQNPDFFRNLELDAVVGSGDYESGVSEVLRWAESGRQADALPGVWLRGPEGWRPPSGAGVWLPATEWVLPDVSEIPYGAYEALYRNDQNRFCGIPDRRELVVQVARGCPVGCSFCDVPLMQGLRERRLSVAATVGYIRDAFTREPFEYVAFYAPTFTLDRRWVAELCSALGDEPRTYPWKCTTTLHHLSEEMVAEMAASGCVRISVGVETFEETADEALPRVKRLAKDRFLKVVRWCRTHKIELNCFVIVGLPGSTPDGTLRTMESIRAEGARVRPTLYTPYDQMHGTMTERELSAFNRQTFVEGHEIGTAEHQPVEYLRLIFDADEYITPSTHRIPTVAG